MPGWFQGRTLFRRRDPRGFFHPPDKLRDILRREQLRSDRSGQPFSLVTFELQEEADLARKVSYSEEVFASRLRVTDEAGMLGNRKIGLVLPYTSAPDAWRVADELRSLMSARIPRLTCEVFEYPAWPSPKRGERVAASPLSSPMSHPRNESTVLCQATPCWKRILDVTGAVAALVVFSPVILAAALAVKLTSPGPLFFRQQREGRNGQPFTIYKIRSMHTGAEAMQSALRAHNEQDGPAFMLTNDPRVTPVGRILRLTCIDELPQLWNVLRGDMSLVGPRPLPIEESVNCDSWHRRRLDVTPGLTCIWQVRGRSRRVPFDEWMRMDLQYVRSRSFFTDLKLLLQTVPTVLSHRGAK